MSGLCDGRLAAAELARLEVLLVADANCRRIYLEYMDVHVRLLSRPDLEGVIPRIASRPRIEAPPRRDRRLSRYVLVGAGTLAASLLVQFAIFGLPGTRGATPPRLHGRRRVTSPR